MRAGAAGDPAGSRRWWHGDGAMWAVALCGAALGGWTTLIAAGVPDADMFRVTVHTVAGALFLVSGIVAHHRRATNKVGPLMMGVGIGFFSEDLQLSPVAWVHTVGQLTLAASGPFLAHLVLAFPTGRLESRPQRALAAIAYLGAAGNGLLNALFVDMHARVPGNAPGLLLVTDSLVVEDVMRAGARAAAIVVSAGLIVVLARRWLNARALMRSLLAPAIAIMLGSGLLSVVGLVFHEDRELRATFVYVYDVLFAALPLAFLAGMVYFYLGRGAVDRLLRRLRDPKEAGEIEDLLARSLRDESLRVAFLTGADPAGRDDAPERAERYAEPGPFGTHREPGLVDRHGVPLDVAPSQVVTPIGGGGGVGAHGRAVLVHDPLLCEDPHVLETVAAAAGLALANRSLAAQLAEVRASRARIVEAADAERRRIERDLQDGAQQRLVTALLKVNLARRRLRHDDPAVPDVLASAAEGLTAALAEIRELAQGLHPALLAEAGLAVALEELAARLPLPVETDLDPLPKFAPNVESAAYFVVAEALTNALKHAEAGRVRVGVRYADGVLAVSVSDDGRGGADLAGGSGLQGLVDRVAALGGDLTLTSPASGGTTIRAVLPVDTH
ncbi:ATP-binding protein [Streptosporangium sp. NPDC002524]|uniref:sensor histidine kinase n=1 Tax=Streptosporangium sp. NPDC002524 TaxID=3154537 RepID=UPI00332B7020